MGRAPGGSYRLDPPGAVHRYQKRLKNQPGVSKSEQTGVDEAGKVVKRLTGSGLAGSGNVAEQEAQVAGRVARVALRVAIESGRVDVVTTQRQERARTVIGCLDTTLVARRTARRRRGCPR